MNLRDIVEVFCFVEAVTGKGALWAALQESFEEVVTALETHLPDEFALDDFPAALRRAAVRFALVQNLDWLRACCTRIARSRHEGEELAQTVAVRVLGQKWGGEPLPRNFRGWLREIARRLHCDKLRVRTRWTRRMAARVDENGLAAAAPCPDPAAVLRRVRQQVSPEVFEAWRLTKKEKLSQDEAAALQGVSTRTIRERLRVFRKAAVEVLAEMVPGLR